ncbi:hypothetical protein EN829_001045 [Mesorhizobium sp. M00.F.Ca.ET.186.01.1.1]|nr:hypothetical protein EN848_09645 [bacterium M00.F.Ca.ET.205.01.1.1]TGU55781.1 hypothetical protein EN795_03380 [bacterium M00.F.Ca.ET.152.01.1.1]TGV39946.1 hypothetical protein EN829_001045 [Mesorhizobium sp. M00.F.Ca.ET.186.01.1.1]TGZ44928.1 hypothetical protein EN805_01040 [bacterium M00.F.Ca.ET.162.01.1.1]
MTDRLTVRFAYQHGWQAVENNRAIETFDSKVEAFAYVRARGARVWLTWGRTVIAGQTVPFDFAAQFQQDDVGRIIKVLHGPSANTWFWTCYDGGARGTVKTKPQAVASVEAAYTQRIVRAGHIDR